MQVESTESFLVGSVLAPFAIPMEMIFIPVAIRVAPISLLDTPPDCMEFTIRQPLYTTYYNPLSYEV